jgi:hypothetical protein
MNSHLLLTTMLAIATTTLGVPAAEREKDTRVYELRTYTAAPGKLDALNARFRDHTLKIFEKHGMENIGYWMPVTNTENQLIYIIAHASRDAAKKSWSEFVADPDWKKAQKESEANGKLLAKPPASVFLDATDYSAAIKPSRTGEPRVFELRTYTASAGNLDALNARFRDHTVALFAKHGMSQVGYWTPEKDQKNSDKTLIYILAHKSLDAAKASFEAFRSDPEWVRARAESEKKAGGSLTEGGMAGVKSVFMKPTDYSPMQ